MCIILSKAGYGDINLLKSYDAGIFLNMMDYERFINDYSSEVQAMNRSK